MDSGFRLAVVRCAAPPLVARRQREDPAAAKAIILFQAALLDANGEIASFQRCPKRCRLKV